MKLQLRDQFGVAYPIPEGKDVVTVGRCRSNDIIIPPVGHPYRRVDNPDRDIGDCYDRVSRKHLFFYPTKVENCEGYVMDLNSTMGTSVDGKKLEPGVREIVSCGESIKLGRLEMTLEKTD